MPLSAVASPVSQGLFSESVPVSSRGRVSARLSTMVPRTLLVDATPVYSPAVPMTMGYQCGYAGTLALPGDVCFSAIVQCLLEATLSGECLG